MGKIWKIQTPPPKSKLVYIWNVDYFDFAADPPPPYGLFPQFGTFFLGLLPLVWQSVTIWSGGKIIKNLSLSPNCSSVQRHVLNSSKDLRDILGLVRLGLLNLCLRSNFLSGSFQRKKCSHLKCPWITFSMVHKFCLSPWTAFS